MVKYMFSDIFQTFFNSKFSLYSVAKATSKYTKFGYAGMCVKF